jgi:hypothetical protein
LCFSWGGASALSCPCVWLGIYGGLRSKESARGTYSHSVSDFHKMLLLKF